jgi:hypothetical protein
MSLSLLMLLTLFLKLKAKMFLANETTQHAFRLCQHKSNDSNKNQSSFAPKNDKPFTLLTQNKNHSQNPNTIQAIPATPRYHINPLFTTQRPYTPVYAIATSKRRKEGK